MIMVMTPVEKETSGVGGRGAVADSTQVLTLGGGGGGGVRGGVGGGVD